MQKQQNRNFSKGQHLESTQIYDGCLEQPKLKSTHNAFVTIYAPYDAFLEERSQTLRSPEVKLVQNITLSTKLFVMTKLVEHSGASTTFRKVAKFFSLIRAPTTLEIFHKQHRQNIRKLCLYFMNCNFIDSKAYFIYGHFSLALTWMQLQRVSLFPD